MSTEELASTEEILDEEGNKRKRSIDEAAESEKKSKIDEILNKIPISSYIPLNTGVSGDTAILEVAPDKVGQIIGSKGAIIQEIQTRTGIKAYVNQDFPEGVNRQVNLTGTESQIKAATELIKLILEQGPTAIHMVLTILNDSITSLFHCNIE